MYKFFCVEEFDAVGGPEEETMGRDGFMETPTGKGRFVVGYIGKHRRSNRMRMKQRRQHLSSLTENHLTRLIFIPEKERYIFIK